MRLRALESKSCILLIIVERHLPHSALSESIRLTAVEICWKMISKQNYALFKHDIERERNFQFIKHCIIEDERISLFVQKMRKALQRDLQGTEDSLRSTIGIGDNLIEITGDQVQDILTILPHINMKEIVCQIQKMCVDGESHRDLFVKQLASSDVGWNQNLSSQQYGCFASKSISAGTLLSQYVGDVRLDETKRSDSYEPDSQEIREASYAFRIGDLDDMGELYIDATHMGNETAFINDGMDQSNAHYFQALINGWCCIFCIASRDIEQGEQILAQYGSTYWESRARLAQRRGAPAETRSATGCADPPVRQGRQRPPMGHFREHDGKTEELTPLEVKQFGQMPEAELPWLVYSAENLSCETTPHDGGSARRAGRRQELPIFFRASNRPQMGSGTGARDHGHSDDGGKSPGDDGGSGSEMLPGDNRGRGAGGGSSGHSEKSLPSKRRRAGGQHESRAACSRYSPCSGEGSAGATGSVALCTPTRTGRLHPHKAMARTSPPPSPPLPRSKQSAILAAPNHLTAATAADAAIPTLPSAGSGWTGTAAVAAAGSVVGPVGRSDDGNLRGSPGPGELGEDASYAEQLEWAIQESLLSSAREAFRTQAATKAESGDSVIDLT